MHFPFIGFLCTFFCSYAERNVDCPQYADSTECPLTMSIRAIEVFITYCGVYDAGKV